MSTAGQRLLRSAVSYLPSESLLGFRALRDLPARALRRPHEADFGALRHFGWHQPVVVDVGANRGQSIRSLRIVLDRPRIIAIEPNPMLGEYLQRRFGGSVDVRLQGLSSSPGMVTLHVPAYGHTAWDTRASADRGEAESFLDSENFAGFRPDRAAIRTSEVPVGPLDDLDLRPDIVKVDVEGLDDLVVQGARSTISATSPLLMVERPQDSTVGVLGELGYTGYGYDAPRTTLVPGDLSGLNSLFLTDHHLAMLRGTRLLCARR